MKNTSFFAPTSSLYRDRAAFLGFSETTKNNIITIHLSFSTIGGAKHHSSFGGSFHITTLEEYKTKHLRDCKRSRTRNFTNYPSLWQQPFAALFSTCASTWASIHVEGPGRRAKSITVSPFFLGSESAAYMYLEDCLLLFFSLLFFCNATGGLRDWVSRLLLQHEFFSA